MGMKSEKRLTAALLAAPCHRDQLISVAQGMGLSLRQAHSQVALRLAELESSGRIARYPDGRYGPAGR